MLRNRSRAVPTKQSLMADHNNPTQQSQTQILCCTKPISSFFNSPKFRAFTTKINPFESNRALISPTSVLDAKASIFAFSNANSNEPFCYHESTNPKSPKFHSADEGRLGLAHLVSTGDRDDLRHGSNKMVLFGSKLRVRIPRLHPNTYQTKSPKSPGDFGTKTKDSSYQGEGHGNPCVQTKAVTGFISVSEMTLSEDYTCVVSHGPNPKTTHIFENHVVLEGCYSLPAADKANSNSYSNRKTAKPENFLSFCYTCKKNLDQKHDIYIYRGEKAFCSSECRNEEMLLDEMES